jgi:hypothetical protein
MSKLKKIKPISDKERWGEISSPGEKVYYPSISLDSKQFPEIKNWDVPHKYQIVIEIKQTSKRVRKDGKTEADFDVVAYKVMPKSVMTDEELELEQAKGLST